MLLLVLVATGACAQGGQLGVPPAKQTLVAGEATQQVEAEQVSRAPKEGTPPPSSSPQGGEPALPPAKQTIVAGEATRQAEAEQGPHAPKVGTPPPSSCPRDINEFKSKVGIRPHPEGRIGPKDMTLINSAVVISRDGIPYVVEAGSQSDDSQQGVLYVTKVPLDPCAEIAAGQPDQPQFFASPFKEGALQVTQIDGDEVVLTTPSGRTVRFNYVTGQFQ